MACAVAAQGRVGIDMEPVGAVEPRILRRVSCAAELARIEAQGLSPTDGWVMKEAVAKCAGRGIGALSSVALELDRASLDGASYWLTRVELSESHCAWLATDRPERLVTIDRVDLKSLLDAA